MAQTATMHTFELTLADTDRGVYGTWTFPVARHPSESPAYLVARLLAFALEHEEGIAFSSGLSEGDEPAVWVKDLTGQLRTWIEVGAPDPARIHRASKACGRVAIYVHRGMDAYLRTIAGARVHAPERVFLVGLDRATVEAIADKVDRRNKLTVTVSGGEVFVELGGASWSMPVAAMSWPA